MPGRAILRGVPAALAGRLAAGLRSLGLSVRRAAAGAGPRRNPARIGQVYATPDGRRRWVIEQVRERKGGRPYALVHEVTSGGRRARGRSRTGLKRGARIRIYLERRGGRVEVPDRYVRQNPITLSGQEHEGATGDCHVNTWISLPGRTASGRRKRKKLQVGCEEDARGMILEGEDERMGWAGGHFQNPEPEGDPSMARYARGILDEEDEYARSPEGRRHAAAAAELHERMDRKRAASAMARFEKGRQVESRNPDSEWSGITRKGRRRKGRRRRNPTQQGGLFGEGTGVNLAWCPTCKRPIRPGQIVQVPMFGDEGASPEHAACLDRRLARERRSNPARRRRPQEFTRAQQREARAREGQAWAEHYRRHPGKLQAHRRERRRIAAGGRIVWAGK